MNLIDWTYGRCNDPSPQYLDLLDRIYQHLLPRTYVEIGVSTGRSMTRALPGTDCIGIDPEPKPRFPMGRQTRIFSLTSDDFFATHELDALFRGVPLDLAFIDGMHHFEFALRDFINLERASNQQTTILIHDCLPIDEASASREQVTYLWTGDIWRLILALRRWRPDLEVAVADSRPSGLGVVRSLDPQSTVLSDRYDEIVEQYLAMPYRDLDDGSMGEQLHRIPGDWATVSGILPAQPFRSENLERLKTERLLHALAPAGTRKLRQAERRVRAALSH